MITELGKENSIFNTFISEIRSKGIQTDPLRFRRNLERIGEVFAYELSKELHYEVAEIESPLGIAEMSLHSDPIVLATILRAGLPLHQGMLNYFDRAECAFVSAFRKHNKGSDDFEITIEYLSTPELEGKVLILCDPMLATGKSMTLVLKEMLRLGKPKAVHIVSAIGSAEGISYVKKHIPVQARFWVGAIDQEMTAQAYIVPGLGDAGDLAFGQKI
jgi:uracil phosphoribosyltransferase